jgi:hypothetical protein
MQHCPPYASTALSALFIFHNAKQQLKTKIKKEKSGEKHLELIHKFCL